MQIVIQAIQNVRANLLRTLLSILGIVIGVAALVVILSMIDGMEQYALSQLSTTTSLEAILIKSEAYETVDGVRLKKENPKVLTATNYLTMLEEVNLDGEGYLSIKRSGRIKLSDSTVAGMIRFINEYKAYSYDVLTGDMPTLEQLARGDRVAVINERLAAKIMGGSSEYSKLVGRPVLFDTLSLEIIGVIKADKLDVATVVTGYGIFDQQQLDQQTADMMIKSSDVIKVNDNVNVIENWLSDRLGDEHDVTVVTNQYRVAQVNQGFLIFRLIMGLIVGVSVVVGGIGVMNVMVISVTERIKEIGIRKAIGAKRKTILLQFLSESITISLLGSIVGLMVGVLFTMAAVPVVKMIAKVPFQAAFTVNTILIIGVIAVLVGIVFGTYPAMKASKLDPVDAIRHE